MNTGTPLQGIGIPYFSEAEWHAAKAVMEDAHTFHDSYAEFVTAVDQAERHLRGQGMATVRVYLRMDEFVPWCKANGRQVDGKARADYAARKAMENDRGR